MLYLPCREGLAARPSTDFYHLLTALHQYPEFATAFFAGLYPSLPKLMIAHSTLTGIIDQYPGATGVLDRYEIDYSGNGNCTLSELFEGNAMRLFEVVREIYTVSEQVEKTMPGSGPSDLTIGDLCNYIIEEHHSYVKSVLPAMLVHGYQVAQAFGSIYAELDQIKKHLTMIRAEFNQHMMMEEEVLFPGAILLSKLCCIISKPVRKLKRSLIR